MVLKEKDHMAQRGAKKSKVIDAIEAFGEGKPLKVVDFMD